MSCRVCRLMVVAVARMQIGSQKLSKKLCLMHKNRKKRTYVKHTRLSVSFNAFVAFITLKNTKYVGTTRYQANQHISEIIFSCLSMQHKTRL